MIGSFTEVKPLFYWVQHILPLVYDDSLSYMELLGKVTKTLNELVENNNLLPDYIMELIKEYISSGEIEKVLAEVLANYMLNVKFPPKGLTPAVGDGSADDTEAIQGCINYAYQNGGMAVYFPSGSYLTQPLTLNEKVTLFGQDRYTTRIVMKGGATKPLFTGTVDEMSLTGLGFDGNMDIQVNNVNLFTITVNSAIITNCLLTDGYDLLNITVNNELQLDNILFRHAVENALVVGGAGYVQGDNLIFKSLSTLIGKNYVVLNTNKSILEEVKCFGAAPNGVLIGGDNNVVNMWCEACQTPYVDNGTNNTIHVYGILEDEKFTGNVTQYIGGFLNQTVVATKKLVARNVIDTAGGTRQESTTGNKTETVNGNDTETVGGDKNETVSGSKSVIVTRNLDENIGTNKISVVNGTNTETVGGDKNETVSGSKSIIVTRSLDENIGTNKISSVKGTKTETITGLYTENANGGKVLVSTDYNENVTNKNITAASIKETLTGNKVVTAEKITFNAKDILINPTNPLQYSHEPTKLNRYFKSIPFSYQENAYDILVWDNFESDIINVKDFGAIGDGITDDLPAFKAAVSASKKNDIIFVPPGNYFWKYTNGTNLLYIPHNILFQGVGASTVIIFDRNTPNNVNIIEWNVEKGVDNHLGGFRNFYAKYDGNFSDSYFAGNNLIYINGIDPQTHISMCLIELIKSVGFSGYGVYLDNPEGKDCFFLSTIQFCLFYGGVYLKGCGDSVNIMYNNFTKGNNNYGIYCEFVTGSACSSIMYNNLTSPKENIFIFNGEQIKICFNQIEQVTFSGETACSIFLSNCKKVLTMSNNVNAHNNMAYCINLLNSTNCDIMLNVLTNPTDKCISVGENCRNTGEFKNTFYRNDSQVEWDIYNNGTLTEHAITPLVLTNCNPYQIEQFGTPSFYFENNKIYFKGVLQATALAANTLYFTLPNGYRPTKNSVLSLNCTIGDNDISSISLVVSSDGSGRSIYAKTNLGLIYLDGSCIELYQ